MTLPGEDVRPLDEFTKEEWREVSRLARPDWTEEQFEKYWDEFVAMKARKGLH